MYLLLTHTDQLEAVRSDRSLLPQAIEEALRFEPPLLQINRTATREVEIAGVTIPEGGSVTTCLGSANHDETRWENAEEFDIFRTPIPHLAFAHGPHMCLGMHLARLETRTLINKVIDRLPNLRLDPGDDDPHIHGVIFRSPTSLPVRFDHRSPRGPMRSGSSRLEIRIVRPSSHPPTCRYLAHGSAGAGRR